MQAAMDFYLYRLVERNGAGHRGGRLDYANAGEERVRYSCYGVNFQVTGRLGVFKDLSTIKCIVRW
jgi:hypothetical protein